MRQLSHLIRRFYASLGARWPSPAGQTLVAELLSRVESEIFWSQPVPDLAHALRSTRVIIETSPQRADLGRAALLHDVGKRHSGIGTIRRAIATGLSIIMKRTSGRMAGYLDHGAIGADELARVGCEDLVVQFARYHHASRPGHLSSEDWETLVRADNE